MVVTARETIEALMLSDMDRDYEVLTPEELEYRVPYDTDKNELRGMIHGLQIVQERLIDALSLKSSKNACRYLLEEIQVTIGRAANLYVDWVAPRRRSELGRLFSALGLAQNPSSDFVMVNPHEFTNFNRSEAELQEALMFAVLVAGKRADQQAVKLEAMISEFRDSVHDSMELTPLGGLWAKIDRDKLLHIVHANRIGQYSRIIGAFDQLSEVLPPTNSSSSLLDLRACTASDLESIPGIGPKTSRFFILHTRPDANVACLDVHILSYLRDLGHSAPKSTPVGKEYVRLENIFLSHAKDVGKDAATLDLEIWKRYTKSKAS